MNTQNIALVAVASFVVTAKERVAMNNPVDMVLNCPQCEAQHVDKPEPDVCQDCGHEKTRHYTANINISPGMVDVCDCCDHKPFVAWLNPPHKSHRCHKCNHVWRPFDFPTNGVAFLQGAEGLEL